MTPLALFIAESIIVRYAYSMKHTSPSALAAVIDSAIAEREKANVPTAPLCRYCGKTEVEHINTLCGLGEQLLHFTPADPTKEKP